MTSLIVFILVVKLYGWWWGLLALFAMLCLSSSHSHN